MCSPRGGTTDTSVSRRAHYTRLVRHPSRAGAEIDIVEIARQDLVLAELVLQPKRDDEFLDLAFISPVAFQVGNLYQLLRDRAGALDHLAGRGITEERPQHAPEIDADMLMDVKVRARYGSVSSAISDGRDRRRRFATLKPYLFTKRLLRRDFDVA